MNKVAHYTGIAPRASLAMGAAGAIVGGSVAAARNIRKVRQGEMSREHAVKNALTESGATGISTAMATAAVTAVGLTGFLSLFGFVAVAVGAKYLADAAMTSQVQGAASPVAAKQGQSGKTSGKPRKK